MNPAENSPQPGSEPKDTARSAFLRLVLIPLLVCLIWAIEIFLLSGSSGLFRDPDDRGLAAYTVFSCIVMGMIVPALFIRRSFPFRATNLFQSGFRSPRRTLVSAILTFAGCYAILQISPPAIDGVHTMIAFLFLLPTGIASAMICWGLLGTHIQAYVRNGGIMVSILTGVAVTGLLFGMTLLAGYPWPLPPDLPAMAIAAGMVLGLFFFAIRDVWAAGIAATTALLILYGRILLPVALETRQMTILFWGVISAGALLAIHAYFLRNFTMVVVVNDE